MVVFVSPPPYKQGNPHFVCGARVLVKPYREKARLVDRKFPDRLDSPVYYPSQLLELDPAYHSVAGICDNSQLLRKHLLEEQAQALEMERMRFYRFGYLFDVLNSGSASEDVNRHTNNNYNDQESSQGLNLPESPFASPIANSIPTAI